MEKQAFFLKKNMEMIASITVFLEPHESLSLRYTSGQLRFIDWKCGGSVKQRRKLSLSKFGAEDD